jgi:translation elongation factor EF-1alpha
VVLVEADLYIGDWILIEGPHTQLEQQVASMEIDRAPIEQAVPGDDIGLKVNEPVRVGDEVFLIVDEG